jgi:hypothetical protein
MDDRLNAVVLQQRADQRGIRDVPDDKRRFDPADRLDGVYRQRAAVCKIVEDERPVTGLNER